MLGARLTLALPVCSEQGCPAGMQMLSCANRCPRRCSDLQEGVVCQDGQACQPGCRCSEGGCCPGPSARHSGSVGWQVGPRVPAPLWRSAPPQASWSRTEAACPSRTVSVRTPRATAGRQGASTRRPAAPAPAGPGGSPARLSPAHRRPTVPGAAGQPGAPAAAHVGPEGSGAASGVYGAGPGRRPLSDAELLDPAPQGHPHSVPWPHLCPWSSLPFFSHLRAHPSLSHLGSSQEVEE